MHKCYSLFYCTFFHIFILSWAIVTEQMCLNWILLYWIQFSVSVSLSCSCLVGSVPHSSLANLSIQLFHALYKYYPIKLLAEYREFIKMVGSIIQGEFWNIMEAIYRKCQKISFFKNKKCQIHDFFNTFWQLW